MADIPPGDKATRKARFDLFLVSFLALFFEILCIRWIPAQVRILGYFTNFVLIACFLGMGLGCIVRWKVDAPFLFTSLFLLLLVTVLVFEDVQVVVGGTEAIFLEYQHYNFVINLYVCLAIFFVFIGLAFVPFGLQIGDLMQRLPAVEAYTINIAGSLAGLVGFSVLSLLSLPPYCWMACGLALFIPLMLRQPLALGFHVLVGLVMVGLVYHNDVGTIWSPYHKITLTPLQFNTKTGSPFPFEAGQNPQDVLVLPRETGFNVVVNDKFYQEPMDLSAASVARYPILKPMQTQYDIPYKHGPHDDVLIIGGGSGNDAAAALRSGARHVDVVDIDPEILKIGRELHPERPYADPRVTITVADGRSYFHQHRHDRRYDLVVFGLLDSHILFSNLSNIRIDSYIYTTESLREAAGLLKPEGMLVISHTLSMQALADRLYGMMREATGTDPLLYSSIEYNPIGFIMMAGPGVAALFPHHQAFHMPPDTLLATDDWPYFYVLKRQLGGDYLLSLGLMLGLSALLVYSAGRSMRRGVDVHFFFLGSAFMLLETRSITSLALLFGSTWMVNSLVIGAILLMILLANGYVSRAGVTTDRSRHLVYALLALSVLLGYMVPLESWVGAPGWQKAIMGCGITFLPIFFAGIIFASSLSRAARPDYALGSNILGGVLGGVVEYFSMVTGFRFLLLVALGLYLISYGVLFLPGRAPKAGEASSLG